MTCGNTLKTFLSGPWPRENGIAVFSCPAYQVRMVFHKCTLFVLPDYYLLMVFFLPSHLLFSWRQCWCIDNWTTWCPPRLQDFRSGHWTTGSSCLEEAWLALASGGRALYQDRWWFIVCRNVYHPWVSKAQMMTEKHHKLSCIWKHSNSSVLVMKKITQEWSKLLNFSETDHGC